MPNQLAKSKRRQSIAEHVAVLEAVFAISRNEKTTVVALIREAIREFVRKRAQEPANADMMSSAVWKVAPRASHKMHTRAQVSRFKRDQREFDQVVLELHLATPFEIEARNSIADPAQPIRMINFKQAHATV
jgi:hypothetical protein